MEPDDFENEYANERKSWLRNSRMPAEAVEQKGTVDSREQESEVAMSARRAREEARLKNARRLRRKIFSAGTTEERRRAHVHPSWWMPEILSQIGGMICLLGASLFFSSSYTTSPLFHAKLTPIRSYRHPAVAMRRETAS
jgi:hypothetical protein